MKKIFLMALTVACSLSAFAQDLDNSLNPLITGVPSLSINPDAVAGGMGDVGVATAPDMNSQHFNAAKYAFAESSSGFSLSYTPWLRRLGVSDIDLAYLAGYYKIGDVQAISASLRFFSLGKIDLRESADINAPVMSVNPYELAFDLGYSRKLSEHFSMAVALRFIASDLSARNQEDYFPGYAFAADISAYYQLPISISTGESKLGIGLNLSNIGTKVSYDKGETSNFLPANIRLGASYLIPFDAYNRLTLSAEINRLMVPLRANSKYGDTENSDGTKSISEDLYSSFSVMKGIGMSFNDNPLGFKGEMREINWSVGAEYAYNEQFFARTGYYNEDEIMGNRKFFTVGAGFKLSAFKLDVGYVISLAQSNPLDQTLRFSLSFDVDGIKALADRK